VKLYNTLTRSLEELKPLKSPTVSMYVCGPTVYDVPHIGHARSAYIFDVLRRYLTFRGSTVKFVRNVTDVDDKIIEKAKQELAAGDRRQAPGDIAQKCEEVAERYLQSYHDMLDRLEIERPSEEPRATKHVVPEMTDFISKLLMQGAAYEASGNVYFAVRKSEGYGTLSNRTLDELQAGTRVEPGEGKQDPLDFALWKAAKPGEPQWPSPWGPGRPGWHIECSAMSTKYLGDTFDIHGGGVDLVFPHHENEIAQAQAAGKPFARCWIHNGLLTVNGEKMSKSLGNFITVEQVLRDYSNADVIKLFFLKTHYRSPIDFSTERIQEAKKNCEEFSRFFQLCDQIKDNLPLGGSTDFSGALNLFQDAMDEDLNTPEALAVLFAIAKTGITAIESGNANLLRTVRDHYTTLLKLGKVFGLFQQAAPSTSSEITVWITFKIEERNQAKKEKDFSKADEIREEVKKRGFLLIDTAGGTRWVNVDLESSSG